MPIGDYTPRNGDLELRGDSKGRYFVDANHPFIRILSDGMVEIDEVRAAALGVRVSVDELTNHVLIENGEA
jgi:hypothetical protein